MYSEYSTSTRDDKKQMTGPVKRSTLYVAMQDTATSYPRRWKCNINSDSNILTPTHDLNSSSSKVFCTTTTDDLRGAPISQQLDLPIQSRKSLENSRFYKSRHCLAKLKQTPKVRTCACKGSKKKADEESVEQNCRTSCFKTPSCPVSPKRATAEFRLRISRTTVHLSLGRNGLGTLWRPVWSRVQVLGGRYSGKTHGNPSARKIGILLSPSGASGPSGAPFSIPPHLLPLRSREIFKRALSILCSCPQWTEMKTYSLLGTALCISAIHERFTHSSVAHVRTKWTRRATHNKLNVLMSLLVVLEHRFVKRAHFHYRIGTNPTNFYLTYQVVIEKWWWSCSLSCWLGNNKSETLVGVVLANSSRSSISIQTRTTRNYGNCAWRYWNNRIETRLQPPFFCCCYVAFVIVALELIVETLNRGFSRRQNAPDMSSNFEFWSEHVSGGGDGVVYSNVPNLQTDRYCTE